MTISLYRSTFDKEFTITSPEQVMQTIMQPPGELIDHIEYIRSLNKAEYDAEKKKLPACTWSGSFRQGTRSIEALHSYSGLVVIDIDKLEPSTIRTLKSQLAGDPYVFFCFVSPSGKGIKILFKVNTLAEHHRSAFLHLKHYVETTYLTVVDPSGKDVSRLCYLSFDPNAILNPSPKTFEVDMKYGDIITEFQTTADSHKSKQEADKVFKVCQKWIEKKFTYTEGQRNVYLHALSCAMNRCGIRQDDTINIIWANFTVPDDKWLQSVKSAYFHNQNEHGSYLIKDIASQDFIAPPYIQTYTDDVAVADIMRITGMLFNCKVPNNDIMDLVFKIARFYDGHGYIDLKRANLGQIMNQAIVMLRENIANQASMNALPYMIAEDMIGDLMDIGNSSNAITTGIPSLDDEMFGGLVPGNFYGIIGMGESFKSVLSQYMCFVNAIKGIPSLYLNSEMSKLQWYERFIWMAFGIDLREAIESGHVSKQTVADFIRQITEITNNNIFVVNGSGHNKTSIMSTIDHIYATTGKKIKLLVSDGLSQWDWAGNQEINAAIANSFHGKDIAKEAHGGEGLAHIALIHISGEIQRWYRDTGSYVRGGKKVLANLDAYFCTSRLVDPVSNTLVNEDDMEFIKGKFYLRLVDKRSRTGTVNKIINVGQGSSRDKLKLSEEFCDPAVYEVKINKNAKQY